MTAADPDPFDDLKFSQEVRPAPEVAARIKHNCTRDLCPGRPSSLRRRVLLTALVAVVGLFGILLGEQIPPLVKNYLKKEAAPTAWMREQVKPHMFGELPQCNRPRDPDNDPGARS